MRGLGCKVGGDRRKARERGRERERLAIKNAFNVKAASFEGLFEALFAALNLSNRSALSFFVFGGETTKAIESGVRERGSQPAAV